MISQNNICGLVDYPEKKKMNFNNPNLSSIQIKENLGDAGYAALYIIGGCIIGGIGYCFSNRQEATRSTYGSTFRSGDVTYEQLIAKLERRGQFDLRGQLDTKIENNRRLAEDEMRNGIRVQRSKGNGTRVYSRLAKPKQSILNDYNTMSDSLFVQRPTTSSTGLRETLLAAESAGEGGVAAAAAEKKVQTQASVTIPTAGQIESEVVTKDVEEGKIQQGEGVDALEKVVVDTVEGV